MTGDEPTAKDRRSRILEGARVAFLRFGYERTSLADIAAGAGVTRTALYHYFPGKEDVLRAVVDEHHERSLRLARDALTTNSSLGAVLEALLQAKFGRLLSAAAGHPNTVELVDATHRLTGSATRAADEAFLAVVVTALTRHGRGDEAEGVADTLIAATKGLMRDGEAHVSKAEFDARVQRLVAWAALS